MNTDPQNDGAISINTTGVGTVTDEMVQARAVELALIAGRTTDEVSTSDWDLAKRELTGGSEADPNDTILEEAPEAERWDPLPGSSGSEVPVTPLEGEDDEGRSLGEKLIDEGMSEAEHDQMLQAARDAETRDRQEP
jgi:hypothetical protein